MPMLRWLRELVGGCLFCASTTGTRSDDDPPPPQVNFIVNNYLCTTGSLNTGTVNTIRSARGVNTGASYGTINQQDYRRAGPSRHCDQCLARDCGYQRQGGHRCQQPARSAYSGPAAVPVYWRPPSQPPHMDPVRDLPRGGTQNQVFHAGVPPSQGFNTYPSLDASGIRQRRAYRAPEGRRRRATR